MDREELIWLVCKDCDDDCGKDNDCVKGEISCLIVQKWLEDKVIEEIKDNEDVCQELGEALGEIKELEELNADLTAEIVEMGG